MRRSFLSVLGVLITVISCTAQNVYVFAYFKGNGEDGQLWTDVSDKISLPEGIRHGTIFTVSDKELQALL